MIKKKKEETGIINNRQLRAIELRPRSGCRKGILEITDKEKGESGLS